MSDEPDEKIEKSGSEEVPIPAEPDLDGAEVLARLEDLVSESDRYRLQAYLWVFRLLEHTRQRLSRDGHVSGRELLAGHRELGIEQFGPMAYEVFRYWGIHSGEDLGRIVFKLIEVGFLRKTDEDRLDDFTDGYDFRREFVDNYPW